MTKKGKGDKIGSAFARFPMLMIKIIETLERNNGCLTLEKFLTTLGVSEKWFMDSCENSKIFNTFTLDKINVFTITTKQITNKKVKYIKLTPRENWGLHYDEAVLKVLRV